ncbi:hypothetical protein AB4527_11620 [Vibrio breoganii]
MTVKGASRVEPRHTGKHSVFIQYLGVCETLPVVLSKILNQVQNDVKGASRTEPRHTGKHIVFIQYLRVYETLPAVLSKILNQVQNDG